MQQTERYMTMTIETTELGAELVSAALDSIGVEKQEIIDRREDVEQFLEANRKHWDFVEDEMISAFSETPRIRIYLPESEAGRKKLEEVQEKLRWLAAQDFGFDIGTLETAYGSVKTQVRTVAANSGARQSFPFWPPFSWYFLAARHESALNNRCFSAVRTDEDQHRRSKERRRFGRIRPNIRFRLGQARACADRRLPEASRMLR